MINTKYKVKLVFKRGREEETCAVSFNQAISNIIKRLNNTKNKYDILDNLYYMEAYVKDFILRLEDNIFYINGRKIEVYDLRFEKIPTFDSLIINKLRTNLSFSTGHSYKDLKWKEVREVLTKHFSTYDNFENLELRNNIIYGISNDNFYENMEKIYCKISF